MSVMIGGRECVRGIDISQYQPSVDYGLVHATREFVYVKASEGSGWIDPLYRQHIAGFRSTGTPIGAYHYLQPVDGRVQAQNFLRVTGNYQGFPLPVAVDWEQAGVSSAVVSGFVAEIERVVGKPWIGPTGQPVACLIYTGNYFNRNDRPGDWARMDMWLAAYTNRNYPNPGPEPQFLPVPGASPPWPQWSVWQCNGGDGRSPGVNGGCDQNVATIEWFKRTLSGRSQEVIDEVTPEDREAVAQRTAELLTPALSALIVGQIKAAADAPPRKATKQDGTDPTQYYLDTDSAGKPVRVPIKSQGELALFKKLGFVDNVDLEPLNGDGNDPVTAAFNALPAVERP